MKHQFQLLLLVVVELRNCRSFSSYRPLHHPRLHSNSHPQPLVLHVQNNLEDVDNFYDDFSSSDNDKYNTDNRETSNININMDTSSPVSANEASNYLEYYTDFQNVEERNESLRTAATDLKRIQSRASSTKIVEELFTFTPASSKSTASKSSSDSALVDLNVVGRGTMGEPTRPERSLGNQLPNEQTAFPCLFLATPESSNGLIVQHLRKRYPDSNIPDWPTQLGSEEDEYVSRGDVTAVPLPIPIPREGSSSWKLLSFAFRGRYVSKSILLGLSSILTDRMDGLWDNLPWNTWTIDPNGEARDKYTGKELPDKFKLGKRNAYNRMIGRDWYGRSLSPGNTAARIKYWIEGEDGEETQTKPDLELESGLVYRILVLQIQEAEMELAESERVYARLQAKLGTFTDDILVTHFDEIQRRVNEIRTAADTKESAETALETFLEKASTPDPTALEETISTFLTDIVNINYLDALKEKQSSTPGDDVKDTFNAALQSTQSALTDAQTATSTFVSKLREQPTLVADWSDFIETNQLLFQTKSTNAVTSFLDAIIARETQNAPPYRGAMGYAPQIDTKDEIERKSLLPYRSPYDLLKEIIEEQFQATVLSCVLENSSLFPETLVLEGTVVLQRRGKKRKVTIGGEEIEMEDDDTFGNDNINMGDTFIVECAGEEAVGLALAAGIPISVERKVWREVSTRVRLGKVKALEVREVESVLDAIPRVVTVESDVVVTKGGEALVGGRQQPQDNSNNSQTNNEEQKEKDDDDDDEDDDGWAEYDREMAKVKEINSLADYDAMTIPEKARYILTSPSYDTKQKLPRPRVLHQFRHTMSSLNTQPYLPNDTESDTDTDVPISQRILTDEVRTTLSPLDEMLVPLLRNVEVRQEVKMRDAVVRNDKYAVEAIERQNVEIEEEKLNPKKKRNRVQRFIVQNKSKFFDEM